MRSSFPRLRSVDCAAVREEHVLELTYYSILYKRFALTIVILQLLHRKIFAGIRRCRVVMFTRRQSSHASGGVTSFEHRRLADA